MDATKTEHATGLTWSFLEHALEIWLDVAPWLLAGLILAGMLKVFFPARLLKRWLGGSGVGPVFKAAIVGTPLPLCSCSVLPTAMQLHRSGASKGATTSFLVATPENGADSIALSYVLLGPAMTILRPVAAIFSAVATGLLAESVSGAKRERGGPPANEPLPCCDAGCGQGEGVAAAEAPGSQGNVRIVVRTAFDLLDDIAIPLLVGILLAAAVEMFVSPGAMAGFGSGLLPMLGIAAISVPMYICATASTPIAASMLAAGISPGTVLVFLLAGPATNLASIAIIRRELGTRATAAYLVGVVGSAIGIGLGVDLVFPGMNIQVSQQIVAGGEIFPSWISILAAACLAGAAIGSRWRRVPGLVVNRLRSTA